MSLSVQHVIDGLTDTISFNITGSDRERGTVTYTLSNVSTDDVCSVRGSVYGSNDSTDPAPWRLAKLYYTVVIFFKN